MSHPRRIVLPESDPDNLDPKHGPTMLLLAAEYWKRECLKARQALRAREAKDTKEKK